MTREAYVGTVCDILEILPPGMVIQRLTADGYRRSSSARRGRETRLVRPQRDRPGAGNARQLAGKTVGRNGITGIAFRIHNPHKSHFISIELQNVRRHLPARREVVRRR